MTPEPQPPALFVWDWRDPAPLKEIAAKVRELSGGTVIISDIDTASDEYMIAIAGREVSDDEALALWDARGGDDG